MEMIVEYKGTKKLSIEEIQILIEDVVGKQCHSSGYCFHGGIRDVQFTVPEDEFEALQEKIKTVLKDAGVKFVQITNPRLEE